MLFRSVGFGNCENKSWFFVHESLNLDFKAEGVQFLVNNLKSKMAKLANPFLNSVRDDDLSGIVGLIGTDLLQDISPFSFVKRYGGTVIETSEGIIPFGRISRFLTPKQIELLNNRIATLAPPVPQTRNAQLSRDASSYLPL